MLDVLTTPDLDVLRIGVAIDEKSPLGSAGSSSDVRSAQAAQRQPGPGGGQMGGPTGIGRGSMAGVGVCRLKGLMMIGGIAGGADGGPLGPFSADARRSRIPWMTACIGSP